MQKTHWSLRDFEEMNINIGMVEARGGWVVLHLHNGMRLMFRNWK